MRTFEQISALTRLGLEKEKLLLKKGNKRISKLDALTAKASKLIYKIGVFVRQ